MFVYQKNDIVKYFTTKKAQVEFSKKSLEYSWVDDYDYSKDIEKFGHITEEGAIKIAKESSKSEKIANVSCSYVEDGEILVWGSAKKKIATYWSVSITTGYNSACGHNHDTHMQIDYYTGKVLRSMSTM